MILDPYFKPHRKINGWIFFGIKYGRISYTFKIKREFLYKTKFKTFNMKDCHFCTTKFNKQKHKP